LNIHASEKLVKIWNLEYFGWRAFQQQNCPVLSKQHQATVHVHENRILSIHSWCSTLDFWDAWHNTVCFNIMMLYWIHKQSTHLTLGPPTLIFVALKSWRSSNYNLTSTAPLSSGKTGAGYKQCYFAGHFSTPLWSLL